MRVPRRITWLVLSAASAFALAPAIGRRRAGRPDRDARRRSSSSRASRPWSATGRPAS